MTDREAALEAKLEAAQLENRLLREKIDALVRALYGKKSEKLDPAQLELLGGLAEKIDEAPAAVEPPAGVTQKAPSKPRRPGPRVPEHLPVKEVVLDPDEVLACPQEWRLMGEEVSEQLDYEPGRFYRRRLIRRKYVRKDAPFTAPVIAPLPPCMQERCLATPELIAQVVIGKYADHLPLYRQSQIYRRAGVELSRQTLCRWVDLAADTCQLLYEWMAREQMAHAYLQIDETPIPYLDPGRGQTAKGYLWVCSLPNGYVIYIWHPSRSAECLQQILPEHYRGIIQCDGYAAYPSVARQRAGPDLELEQGPVQLASCWAHTRRKFFEAHEHAPSVAGWILGQIAQLYRIETRLRERRAGPGLCAVVRSAQSAPILARLRKAFILLRQRYRPQCSMAKAIDYALGQWTGLKVFIKNGIIDIDNNAVERAIRPTKIGAKNWTFIGSETSGRTAAILYTLIESAKRYGLDPYQYLLLLLRELPAATNWQIQAYTPAAIAKSKRLLPANAA
jgi:transposase